MEAEQGERAYRFLDGRFNILVDSKEIGWIGVGTDNPLDPIPLDSLMIFYL